MKDKGHFIVSLLKSTIRIAGCVATLKTKNNKIMAGSFLLAEVLGIVEEVADKR